MKMSVIFDKPYLLFGGVILFLWIMNVLSPTKIIDIQIHDTYFVLAFYHLTLLGTILLLEMGIIYWCFPAYKLTRWMTIVHTIFTIVTLLLFFIWYSLPSEKTHYIIYADSIVRIQLVLVIFLLFIFAQIIFAVNLLIALFK